MANKKIAYSCQSCGAIHFKWAGKCPDCGAWNSLVEEFEEGGSSHFTRISEEKRAGKESGKNSAAKKIELVKLSGEAQEFSRIKTNIGELDRVLGGGLVQGSVVLIGRSRNRKINFTFANGGKFGQTKSKNYLHFRRR